MKTVLRIARKEFGGFFSSPVAFLFIAAFLAVTLFVFFWVDTFFANNIAEVQPLFSWMPILLIFLTAAITMRLWAEERRSGTLEFLLTSEVSPISLVLGKFLACMGLVAVALLLTIFLPITVSFMGPLDWGPVLGGYTASLFLAAAYVSIGLYVSSRSENQIVSLLLTTLVCVLFYLVGSTTLTSLLSYEGAEFLKLLGTGSRFQSITRGVIDFRDLYYYVALMGVFLSLNVYDLEKLRWVGNPSNAHHRRWQAATVLLAANFLAANFWLAPLKSFRADMTQGHIYSISPATKHYLAGLQEPLLIRGYFSSKTHPLLAPLVPRLRNLLEEYAVAGGSKVRVEFVDPLKNPDLEREANEKYGIKPVPFQTTSRYQDSITNSYFDILVKYGDQFQVLNFRDLIAIKEHNENKIQVVLNNPEYQITRAIKKVLYAYQAGGNLLASINKPVVFTGYISPDGTLPPKLVTLKKDLQGILAGMQKSSSLFTVKMVDPEAAGGAVAKKISTEYGFRPMAASLFDQHPFWFYMTLACNGQVVDVPLPQDLQKSSLKRDLKAGLERFATGFTKTVAMFTPPSLPYSPYYGMAQGKHFSWLRDMLSREYNVVSTNLKDGHVPDQADLLVVASPKAVGDKQLFAIDQFLMRGGTVVLATSPFDIRLGHQLAASRQKSGLEKWLAFNGISMDNGMVLDPQNAAFPVPVERQVGGFEVRETKMIDYPYLVDIRPNGMDQKSGMLAGLNQVTMSWASPIRIDAKKNSGRKVIRLLESSPGSWVSDSTDIVPDFRSNGQLGFSPGKKATGRQLLGVAVEGRFTSFFKGKPSPLTPKAAAGGQTEEAGKGKSKAKKEQVITRMIDKSPESARIILFSSGSFLTDTSMKIGSVVSGTRYVAPARLLTNTVDWSLADPALLSIRNRGQFSRLLMPMSQSTRVFWEYLNYGLALAGLLLVFAIRFFFKKQALKRYQHILAHNTGRA